MPQHGHRKPFSAKQKKKQLQLKREKKRGRNDGRLFVKVQMFALDPFHLLWFISLFPTYFPSKNICGTVYILCVVFHAFSEETGSAGVKSRDRSASSDRSSGTFSGENIVVKRLNDQPASSSNKRYDPNRYIKLIFVSCSFFFTRYHGI